MSLLITVTVTIDHKTNLPITQWFIEASSRNSWFLSCKSTAYIMENYLFYSQVFQFWMSNILIYAHKHILVMLLLICCLSYRCQAKYFYAWLTRTRKLVTLTSESLRVWRCHWEHLRGLPELNTTKYYVITPYKYCGRMVERAIITTATFCFFISN